jgi:hypothetical protein
VIGNDRRVGDVGVVPIVPARVVEGAAASLLLGDLLAAFGLVAVLIIDGPAIVLEDLDLGLCVLIAFLLRLGDLCHEASALSWLGRFLIL